MTFLETVLAQSMAQEQLTLCMIEDVLDEQLVDQPGGVTNHPAWVLGHLTLCMDKVARRFGVEVDRDESWYAPFGWGSKPSTVRSDYPSRDELIGAFTEAWARLRRTIRDAGETRLDEPTASAELAPFFPTLGHSTAHILLTEGAFHTGQLSAWRRAKGLPPVFELEGTDDRLVVEPARAATR